MAFNKMLHLCVHIGAIPFSVNLSANTFQFYSDASEVFGVFPYFQPCLLEVTNAVVYYTLHCGHLTKFFYYFPFL